MNTNIFSIKTLMLIFLVSNYSLCLANLFNIKSSKDNETLEIVDFDYNGQFEETKNEIKELEKNLKNASKAIDVLKEEKNKYEEKKFENEISPAINDFKNKFTTSSTLSKGELLNAENNLYTAVENFIYLNSYYNFAPNDDNFSIYQKVNSEIRNAAIEIFNDPITRAIAPKYNPQIEENTTIISKEKLLEYETKLLNKEKFDKINAKIISVYDKHINDVEKQRSDIELKLNNAKKKRDELIKKLNKEKTDINSLAIWWGLPLFCFTILALFLGPSIIKRYKNSSDSENESSNQTTLEVSTVLLLTMSILILGLSSKINSDVLGTLLGGISGYVLNRVSGEMKSKKGAINNDNNNI